MILSLDNKKVENFFEIPGVYLNGESEDDTGYAGWSGDEYKSPSYIDRGDVVLFLERV